MNIRRYQGVGRECVAIVFVWKEKQCIGRCSMCIGNREGGGKMRRRRHFGRADSGSGGVGVSSRRCGSMIGYVVYG